jgi:hypothetical protein
VTKATTQQSNPFSTGSGGANFETRIQAAFTVLMLTGRVSPCLPPWPITRIKLQGSYAEFKTDDFIVFTRDPRSHNEARLLAQIKHDVSITERDETFAKVIQAAWNDFNDPSVFTAGTDALALITGPLSATDINHVRPLLEWARHSEDEREFLIKVNTRHFSSDTKIAKLEAFKANLTCANGGTEVSEKQLWEFMKSFHLLGYDLDTESGNTLSLIQSLIAQSSTERPSSLWSQVVDAVQSANQNAGTITLDTLPREIVGSFNTRDNIQWDSDLRKLKEHGEYIIGGIRMSVGGVRVERPELLTQLLEACERSKFVFISGGRGAGKSSLVREFSEYMNNRAPVFCLRTEDLDKPHLDNVFSSMGLVSSIRDLEAGFALMPKSYLLIESIEKLLELQNSSAFTDLLQFLNKRPGWTVIATGRDYAYQQIVFNYFQPTGLDHYSLIVDNFQEHEIQGLCAKLEPLRAIAGNPSLAPLLKNPFFTDLAYRVAEAGTQFSGSEGEKEFRAAVWRDVIAKEHVRVGGMPLKRRQAFLDIAVARAKQMVYGVPEADFDAETLLGLEEDDLIRRDVSNGLVSPAHDVLEDWALERYIDDVYRRTSDDVARFLDAVGHEPAMNRAFRLWLYQKLRYGDNVNALILDILNNPRIQRYWQDETISAVLLGDNSYDFLKELGDRLFDNDGELLKRFCFILRISCKTPNQDLIRQLSGAGKKGTHLFLQPYGHGWDSTIRFLFENIESLPGSLASHLIAVLDEWSSSIHLENELPVSAREAGLLALRLLDPLKDSYRDDDGNRKKVLSVIIKTVPAIQNEFSVLLEADVLKTGRRHRRPHYVADFCKMAFEGINTAFLCKHVPDTVIKLALHEWLIDEVEEDDDESPRGGRRINVEGYFGLHSYRYEFFPASGAKGPFQQLLRFHPRKGLDFILQLFNLTAEKYAHSNLDSPSRYSVTPEERRNISAEQIEIPLEDQTSVKQYCSGRLWVAYRGHSVVPYLLQSALMALENWLISFAEGSGSQKNLEWVFDYILRNSNSVMPTAVLASLAAGFPNKLGKAALPLLRAPSLYSLDMARTVQERGGNEINWFASGFHRDALAELYTEERRAAALRPWRKEHLEDLITRLQFTDLRQEALAVIDELRSKVPESENWRFRFHRIDSRGWKPVEDRENRRIIFESQGLEPDLEEIQQKSQEEMALYDRFSRMYLWADKIFDRETPDREYYASWHEALQEARNLLEILKGGTAGNLVRMFIGGLVKAAAAFLRDHSSEMGEEDASWCAEIVVQAVMSNADTEDMAAMADKTDHDGAAAAASVLPTILDVAEIDDEKLFVKKLIATALTHVNENVRAGTAHGIREHLWQREPEFAQKCILGTIEYARLELENSYRRRAIDLSLDDDGQDDDGELSAWVDDFRERLAIGDIPLSTHDINTLGFDTHSQWHILTPCLMIPNGSTDPHHVALLARMLTLFFTAEKSVREHRSDRMDEDIHIHYELRLSFTSRFAEYLIALRESGSQLFVDQLLEGCDSAPEVIDHLLLNIAFFTERSHKKELYWEFWGQLSKKVQDIAIETAGRDSRYREEGGSRKLIRGMLKADAPWQKLDYENQDIALGKDLILEFVNYAGKNVDVFEALTSLMYNFPRIFFEPGVHILAKHQAELGGTRLLSGVNTAFYLEGSIQQYLQVEETGPLARDMHQSCFTLLNAIVETASSKAYYLREQLIHSRRIS